MATQMVHDDREPQRQGDEPRLIFREQLISCRLYGRMQGGQNSKAVGHVAAG
jgi:hypothetical protein